MTSITNRRPSPAIVVAIVALFVAFGGTATAALVMTGKDIKNGTLTGKDVKNRSLGKKELSKKAIKSLKGKAGPAGPAGAAGTQGPAGAQGPAGPSKAYVDNNVGDITDQFTRILEVAIEPGSYIAQVNLQVLPAGANGQIECRLRALGGAPTLLGLSLQFMGDVPANGLIDSRTISYGGGFTAPEGGIVEMLCKSGPNNPINSQGGDLVVTKVGELVTD